MGWSRFFFSKIVAGAAMAAQFFQNPNNLFYFQKARLIRACIIPKNIPDTFQRAIADSFYNFRRIHCEMWKTNLYLLSGQDFYQNFLV